MVIFVDISNKKSQIEYGFALHYLYLRSILEKLKDLIRAIYYKEWDGHDDIDEQEGSYSWYPRVEKVKTVSKESRPKGC